MPSTITILDRTATKAEGDEPESTGDTDPLPDWRAAHKKPRGEEYPQAAKHVKPPHEAHRFGERHHGTRDRQRAYDVRAIGYRPIKSQQRRRSHQPGADQCAQPQVPRRRECLDAV